MSTVQGIYITVLGMTILFAALLILMLAAVGLERLFRSRVLKKEESLGGEKELVAAIAVAIATKLRAQSSKLEYPISNIQYRIPEQEVNAWKSWGRYRQLMGSRRVKGHRG
jgi:Na+-transporting methylmalonyl-CoA/oxaloacetate decarboxylase gamma subunit